MVARVVGSVWDQMKKIDADFEILPNEESYWEAQEAVRVAHLRWALWLGIANAGGLVAVSGHIADKLDHPIAYLMLPSCWMFAVGLLFAGLMTALRSWRGRVYLAGYDLTGADAVRNYRHAQRIGLLEDACGGVAGLLAAVAVLYPLAVVTIRYMETGALSGGG